MGIWGYTFLTFDDLYWFCNDGILENSLCFIIPTELGGINQGFFIALMGYWGSLETIRSLYAKVMYLDAFCFNQKQWRWIWGVCFLLGID